MHSSGNVSGKMQADNFQPGQFANQKTKENRSIFAVRVREKKSFFDEKIFFLTELVLVGFVLKGCLDKTE